MQKQLVTLGLKYFNVQTSIINRKSNASINWNLYNKQSSHFGLSALLLLNIIKSEDTSICACTAQMHAQPLFSLRKHSTVD